MEVTRALHESISWICEIPAERIHDDSTLADLGFDSLASAEVLTDLEIRLGKELPVDALRRLNHARTVGDVASILEEAFVEPSQRSGP
jgi:acyl carrier protein